MDTPLLECLLHHHDEVAQLLIEAGADINQRGYQGATPLLYALGCLDDLVYERSVPPKVNLSLIRLLLEQGADPSCNQNSTKPRLIWRARREIRD